MKYGRFEDRLDWLEKGRQYHGDMLLGVLTDGEYSVERYKTMQGSPFLCRLSIKRLDKEPIRSWSILQDIKNQIVGKDRLAIEIYPRQQNVTDTANIYHLWVAVRDFEKLMEQYADLIPYQGKPK